MHAVHAGRGEFTVLTLWWIIRRPNKGHKHERDRPARLANIEKLLAQQDSFVATMKKVSDTLESTRPCFAEP